ncbi:MAG: PINc/VapC family ATPase [Nanoarchaeota archaeon]
MREPQHVARLVPDTSVLIEGLLSSKLSIPELEVDTIVIHEAAIALFEHLAYQNKAVGFLGLDELERIKEYSSKLKFTLEFVGKRPMPLELKNMTLSEVDSQIRDLAYEQDGTLFTSDKVQWRICQTKGIQVVYVKPTSTPKPIELDSFFDSTTMSVHLRENVPPMAKKGKPGAWEFVKIKEAPILRQEIQDISREIIEQSGIRNDGFIEIERPGSTIVQLGSFRIVITKPPFSDGWEITAVRPVRTMKLEDYSLSEKLLERITSQAEGVLIAGAPGMGKSTFAQTLAEYYAAKGKIVKTIEAPRDMVLSESITQYAISHGDAQEVHDVLLLSRPDYTIFDEMRNTGDFELFADLRLAGIGLAGVVHAKNPIDAIQRFVGRIELGMIPQVIDTVIFIDKGQVAKVLSLQMTVKVPSGMTEADLARPVVVVTDFETRKLEYELYSYGEETVVIPVRSLSAKQPTHSLAAKAVEQHIKQYASNPRVELTSDASANVYVQENEIGKLIGKDGGLIKKIEEELGLHLEVQSEVRRESLGEGMGYESTIGKKHIMLKVDSSLANKMVSLYHDNDYLISLLVGKDGNIKLTKSNKIGKIIEDSIHTGEKIKIVEGQKQ